MTEATFRKLALELPGATEGSHMGHPDFRVGGKIFATLLSPEPGWGMVALTPDEQELFVHAAPAVFVPAKGGWGRQGSTNVRLSGATTTVVRDALLAAWKRRAPRALLEENE